LTAARWTQSGHQEKARELAGLTSCQGQTEGQVRTTRESETSTSAHFLSTVEGGTGQVIKRKRERASGTHVLLGTKGGTTQDKRDSETSTGTHFLSAAKGRTTQGNKRSETARGTYSLSTAECVRSQDNMRKRDREWHSRTVDHR
jgi:hypothetical protein